MSSGSYAAMAYPEVSALPTSEAPTDGDLVERVFRGDRWAEEALYRRHVHRVTGVVAKLLRNSSDIEDVVQETFLCGFRDLLKINNPEKVGAWLVGIAVHRVHNQFRRRRLQRLLGLDRSIDDERLSSQVRHDASHEARAELALLDEALDRMTMRYRAPWVLFHLEGYLLSEVAALTGCSLATVKRRIAEADARISKHFGGGRDV